MTGTDYFDKDRIRNVLSERGLIVRDIYLEDEKYTADVYLEINAVTLYSLKEIKNIVEKIESLETLLVKQGFIHEIKFGDIHQGSWRIVIYFLNEEEIEKWEEDAIKQ